MIYYILQSDYNMRILFISNDLIAGNIAHILTKSGHQVRLYIAEKGRRGNFHNIISKTTNWKLDLKWVGKKGLIIFDDIGYGHHQDRLRKEGYNVFGGSLEGDRLEKDRVFAQEIFNEYKIKSIPSYNFSNIDDAISFVKKNPCAWVIKQNDHLSKSINFVGSFDDGRDVIEVLKSYKNNNLKIKTITLQKKIFGIEIAITRYFNGSDWIGPSLINIEHKKFFPGDLGPTTSEMGTLGWYEDDEENRLVKGTLFKIKPYLSKINYRGIFDINCIVNKKGIFPLEATSRFGSPIAHLQSELNISPWFEILNSVSKSERYNLKYKKGFGIVVVIAIPPFPYAKKINDHSQVGTRIYFDKNIKESEKKSIHFEEISFDKVSKQYYISDDRGYILYVTGVDKSISNAIKRTYRLIEKIHIPKMFYRNDIGLKFMNKDILKLKKWGYIK